jgi:hypothetical protein
MCYKLRGAQMNTVFHHAGMRAMMLAAMGILFLSTTAVGDDIPAGVDLFTTQSGSVDATLPADFFDPGSDPFSGIIIFGSDPLDPSSFGNTDTIVRRSSSAPLPDIPSTNTIPIEIVALNLVSVNPITVTYNSGTSQEQWKVQITLAPTPPPSGTITIIHDHTDGGTFDSTLPVVPRLIFTRIGDNATRQTNEIPIELVQLSLVSWSHTPPTNVFVLSAPLLGLTQTNFWAGGTAGDPNATLQILRYDSTKFDLVLQLTIIPEPSPSTLLALGAIAFALMRRRA